MDEVDKIIVYSLRQIGCKLETYDNEIFGLEHFSPDLLVKSVSRCLREIKPDALLPSSLPESMNMAQRFTIASTLAEVVLSCGYRGDIGYQTFLYPSVVSIRRLFMFLIEQLPKVHDSSQSSDGTKERNEYSQFMKEIKRKISMELNSPWVPQYCRGIANRKTNGGSSLTIDFLPQLNLHIPHCIEGGVVSLKEVSYQVPSIFQQTSAVEYDLVSSVLHRSAIDLYDSRQSPEVIRLTGNRVSTLAASIKPLHAEQLSESESIEQRKVTTPLQSLLLEVESLKSKNDWCIRERQQCNNELTQLRQKRCNIEAFIGTIKQGVKIHERTCVILENPTDNIRKLEALIDKTRERRQAVENQWQLHREPAIKRIDELQKLRQTINLQNIQELREAIHKSERSLREKTNVHAQLADELKRSSINVAPRKEYTKRIYEFIGNIRKQRNDIHKILDDTRDLQKQLNSVSDQLQRQFNYTDDLLFQSAKLHVHAKNAYKLLASLHASCNEICDMVSQTGQTTKEIRDFEVQIDRERMNKVDASLAKITKDIQQFQIAKKEMRSANQLDNKILSN